MDTVWILVRQILQMFLLSGLGFALYRGKKITAEGSKALGNILIYLALPAVIINSFLVERTAEHLYGILYSAGAAAVILLVSILISRAFFRKRRVWAASIMYAGGCFTHGVLSAEQKHGADS